MKKMISKVLSLSLAVVLSLGVAACSNTKSETASNKNLENKFPTQPIEVIVSFAAGGSSDLGVRALMPYVEKELGVPMVVVNKPGAGGWVGWEELLHATPDGNTIALINTPHLITGYLDPKVNREENLDNFEFIANHVTDPGVIAIRKDEKRFTNIKELMEYAKNDVLTTTSTGIAGDDHIAALKLNKKFGTKFNTVHNGGASESVTSVLGGHVDVLFANVGDVKTLAKSDEIKVLAVMAEQRSDLMPDVPTLKENGYDGVVSWSARGFAAPKGVDADKLKIIRESFEKAIKNVEHGKKMEEMGLQVDYQGKDNFLKSLKGEEKGIVEIKDLLKW